MKTRYKPKVDGLFLWIFIPTNLFLIGGVALAFLEPPALFIMLPVFLFSNYFFISPLFGYVELRESTLFIKYGFSMKKEIPYSKIRSAEKQRKWYSETMLSLKNSMEHVNIKYNTFDVTAVSVVDNEGFVTAVNDKIKALKN